MGDTIQIATASTVILGVIMLVFMWLESLTRSKYSHTNTRLWKILELLNDICTLIWGVSAFLLTLSAVATLILIMTSGIGE